MSERQIVGNCTGTGFPVAKWRLVTRLLGLPLLGETYPQPAKLLTILIDSLEVEVMPEQICLKCGRGEYDSKNTSCKDCGGTLWFPQNVGGKPGNTSIDEARKLIKLGKKPWESV